MNRAPALRSLNELLACKAIRRQYDRALALGYGVQFRQYCEDAQTPGLLGMIGGKCDYAARLIVVSTARRPLRQIAAILKHECDHAAGMAVAPDDPANGLRCGNH